MGHVSIKSRLRQLPLLLGLLASQSVFAGSFVYEGRLDDRGTPANGRYDFQLVPYAGEQGSQALAEALSFWGIEVRDSRFRIDFETPLALGSEVWIGLAVRAGSESSTFSAIPGRSKALAAPLIGACWSTSGDIGSDPAVNFLGTTDAQPLVLRTANARSLRIEPSSITFGSPALPITTNTIGGSHANTVSAGVRGATIAGGGLPSGDSDPSFASESPNRVTGHYGTVGGGYGNRAGDSGPQPSDSPFATVGGGDNNTASGERSTVGGGFFNDASGPFSTVGGGRVNIAGAEGSTVGGGRENTASGLVSTVGGGVFNTAVAISSTVSGGENNIARGQGSTVSGGIGNTASGTWSTVGGGRLNCAGGDLAWAGGYRAKGRPASNPGGNGPCSDLPSYPGGNGDEGTFVWADRQDINFVSTGDNQFLIRAAGGFGLNTAPPTSGIVEMTVQSSVNGGDVANLWLKQRGVEDGILFNVASGSGSNNAGFFIDHYDGSNQARRMELAANGSVLIRSNITGANSGVTMAAGGGSFTSLSDRRVKTAIESVDALAILERVVELPISTWSYIAQGTDVRHIGPMAQDFKSAFAVGESDTGITTIDADGVALAAIQGLNAKLEAENTALRSESTELRARLERLEALLGNLAGER